MVEMRDAKYFTHPKHDWQKRYEALRASFVDRLPAKVVADRFGYTPGYVHLLRHQFKHGKFDFSEPVAEGKIKRRKVTAEVRDKIRSWREKKLSAGEITELLYEDGVELSVTTVERVLAEEGFPRLPRRTRLKIGMTVHGAEVPKRACAISIAHVDKLGEQIDSAGLFLFAPFLARFDIDKIVKSAGLPGTKVIHATNYLLSFLALKLMGTERYAHAGDHGFDRGAGLFAGLNVLPKCTAMSTYSYQIDETQVLRLQQAFVKQASKLGLYDGGIVNLDFHTIPHFGDESELDKHWAGARNKKLKGALTMLAQDSDSKLLLYTDADIMSHEIDEQAMGFLSFWKGVRRGVKPTLVFDSKFTTYAKLSELDGQNVKFITLRRRGSKMIEKIDDLKPWVRVHIPHLKRKFANPLVHESTVNLRDYEGELRQIIMKNTGHEKPTFIITNDFNSPTELVVGNYARRWRVENGIAEAVKFFHLNALSSPILVKVHFDVVMTVIADTLYSMLAQKLRGFESCDAPKIYRHFVRGKGTLHVKGDKVQVVYPRRAHNPILRKVEWDRLPMTVPGLKGSELSLKFR